MKRLLLFLCIALAISGAACNKDDNKHPANGDYHYGPGNIFIKQGTSGIRKLNMQTGEISLVMPDWPDAGWDISWDGTKGVKELSPSSYDTRYIIFDISNGATLKEIFYEPNDNNGGLPYLSPDGSKLALTPTFDDGLVILDMNGHVLKNIAGYGDTHTFKFLDPITWEAGGTILFKKDGGLWRTTADFSRATKVRDIPFSDWRGYAAASPDGKKIALSLGGHIWLMNADGSDFHQVTESIFSEVAPCFSPDSKYIAMKGNPRAPLPGDIGGNADHLCVIPADGQVYKTYPGEDDRVIHPMAKGDRDPRGLGVTIVGDFVWRE
ncbi:hypothetical protein [Parapedobacter defluvii]|nr:hypothetical protein [Parapedobacter defluvii]